MNQYALWLHEICGFGRKKIDPFVNEGINAKDIWEMPQEKLVRLCAGLFEGNGKADKVCKMLLSARSRTPEQAAEELKVRGLNFVSMEDEEYPGRLRNIPDPPFGLYYKGRLPSDRKPSTAIIGARSCSSYGLSQAERFGRVLAGAGIQVVSGLARGIDGAAGNAAAQLGESFAVMGCGANVCYPKENRHIYDKIAETGGIISEYPADTAPIASLFPPRNRIISGLSDAVLVIEARNRSGTLITVDMALEQGRDVFALPGRVCDGLSEGCISLIRQGAQAAYSPEDIIMHFFGFSDFSKEENADTGRRPDLSKFTPLQQSILSVLHGGGSTGTDIIVRHAEEFLGRRVSVREVTSALFQLQMYGAVKETYEGYYDLTVENRDKRG